jgi:acetylornithine deacetylase/succinyl-diaminopimelate desuccinylase family protein
MTPEQTTRLLQDLVRIPSVSPHGDPGTAARNTGEAALAGYVADFLQKLSLDVEVHEVEPGRPNVTGHFASRGGKRRVALAPHLDTVSVAGMTIDPFGATIEDGRLRGRGACDTKGSMAAFLSAMANLVRNRAFREGNVDVTFCAVMGEEHGNEGARALLRRGFRADFAIAGEPTGCRVVYAHKGALWFAIITRGKSAHGSTPERGDNAISKMCEVVPYLTGPYTEQLRQRAHPVVGQPTINVGIIRGGSAANIVPNRCEIEIDRRTVPGEQTDAIIEELRAALKGVPGEIDRVRDCPPLWTDPGHAFVQKLSGACERPDALTTASWFCDAAVLSEAGIPAVAFGPGDIAQAHTADEYIEVAQLHRAAEVMTRFLESCSGEVWS